MLISVTKGRKSYFTKILDREIRKKKLKPARGSDPHDRRQR